MKSKNVWKFGILSLGLASIVVGSTVGLTYAFNINKEKNKFQKINEVEKEELKNKKITLEQIIDGEIIDFKVEDYVGFIKSIKNGETPLSSLINGEILSWMESIDDNTYKIILNIILNKGLLDINNKDEEAIAKVLSIFFKNNKWFKFIKYIPLLINNGINEIITKDDNVLLNELLPFLNKVADELIKKPENKETEKQKTKRLVNLKNLKLHLSKIAIKFLISGYNNKIDEKGQIVETALEQMTNDVLKIIYLVASEKIPEKIPVYGGPIKPIIKDAVYGIVEQLFEPSSKIIKKEINDLEKKIKSNNQNVKALNSNIEDLANKITAFNNKKGPFSTKALSNDLKSRIKQFSLYNFLMFKLGISERILKNTNFKSDREWYEKAEESYCVLAKTLWNIYPDQNKKFKKETDWFKAVMKAFEDGQGKSWWGYSYDDHDTLDALVKESYNNDIFNSLEVKWKIIEINKDFLVKNKGKPLSWLDFANGYAKLWEYETEVNNFNKHNANKILREKEVEDKTKVIKSSINKIKTLNNDVYKYETQNKITKKTLKANNLLKGKGILFLSQKEIEHILYKIKDLLLNINSYIDTSYDRTFEAFRLRQKIATRFLLFLAKGTIKSKIDEIIKPIIEKIVTADLKNNFKFIDFIKIANILYKISNTGLKDIEANDVLYLVNVIKKFNKDFDDKIKLSNGDIINIYNVLKKGFNSLKRPNKISILIKILDFTNIPNHIKAFIKPTINSWTITNENQVYE